MQFDEIYRFTLEPDIYSGDSCDEIRPRWMAHVDKEGLVEMDGNIEISPKALPAGTQVIIEIPVCPKCSMTADMAKDLICECGFSWKNWINSEYS